MASIFSVTMFSVESWHMPEYVPFKIAITGHGPVFGALTPDNLLEYCIYLFIVTMRLTFPISEMLN